MEIPGVDIILCKMNQIKEKLTKRSDDYKTWQERKDMEEKTAQTDKATFSQILTANHN